MLLERETGYVVGEKNLGRVIWEKVVNLCLTKAMGAVLRPHGAKPQVNKMAAGEQHPDDLEHTSRADALLQKSANELTKQNTGWDEAGKTADDFDPMAMYGAGNPNKPYDPMAKYGQPVPGSFGAAELAKPKQTIDITPSDPNQDPATVPQPDFFSLPTSDFLVCTGVCGMIKGHWTSDYVIKLSGKGEVRILRTDTGAVEAKAMEDRLFLPVQLCMPGEVGFSRFYQIDVMWWSGGQEQLFRVTRRGVERSD